MSTKNGSTEPSSRMPTWLAIIIALVLLGILGLVVAKIVSGLEERSKPKMQEPEVTVTSTTTVTTSAPTAETEEVAMMLALPEVDNAPYLQEDGSLLFRTPSGNEACVITPSLPSLADHPWVISGRDLEDVIPDTPGIACSMVRYPPVEEPYGTHCLGYSPSGGVGTVWEGGQVYGSCDDEKSPLEMDARNHEDARMTEILSLPYGQRIRLNDWACGVDGVALTCLRISTGNGISLDAVDYGVFF